MTKPVRPFDGALRDGRQPEEIIDLIVAKQTKNEGRVWPDWRLFGEDQAIEHNRTGEMLMPLDTPSPLPKEPVAWMMRDKLGCDYITMDQEQAESWPTKTPLFAATPSPLPQMVGADDDIRRAASALLDTLWQHAWSGSRTHEENWQEMDRRFPQARWLHTALKAAQPAPAEHVTGSFATVSDHNAAYDPANDAFGGAFRDGFREGWLFARDPGFEDREELEVDYSREVDIAPSECWDAYKETYFAMLPLAAIPEVGATVSDEITRLKQRIADLTEERDNLSTIVATGIDDVAGAALDDAEETIKALSSSLEVVNKYVPDYRKLAVEIVDGIRGYTFEFSSHPAAHREDYDFIEQKLRAALAATSEGSTDANS
ncbi:hypothetical protein [Rhizobium sp. GCM10022189]|uniref:hypothetical protein n=1 Tax=Rhizobium sp. GCM10022189 TaxID=3252654 RepID=UPI00361ED62A